MSAPLLSLVLIFAQLSVAAFGGGVSVLPEMQRQMVQVHGWMSASEFTALYGLAQAAPGPNLMVVTLLGWKVAGFWGALVSTFAMVVPSSILTGIAFHAWNRFRDAPWRAHIQAGLVPVTVGLVVATAFLIAKPMIVAPGQAAIAGGVAFLSLRTKLHPLLLLGLGAASGLLLLG